MKVRAKHWLNFDGTWHRCGEVFDLPAAEAERLRGSVEWLDIPVGNSGQIVEGIRKGVQEAVKTLFDAEESTVSTVAPEEPETVQEEPKKRRRTSKKTTE